MYAEGSTTSLEITTVMIKDNLATDLMTAKFQLCVAGRDVRKKQRGYFMKPAKIAKHKINRAEEELARGHRF